MLKIGILFERQSDIMSNPDASEETHYHWRETEEVEAVATNLRALDYDVDLIGTNDAPVFIGAVETVTTEGAVMKNQVLDLQAKRRGGFRKINVDLSLPELQKLRDITLDLMQLFKPLDYATFDFRVSAGNFSANNQAYLLDINADATLHPERSLAQIALQNSLSYRDLIEVILQTSLKRWN